MHTGKENATELDIHFAKIRKELVYIDPKCGICDMYIYISYSICFCEVKRKSNFFNKDMLDCLLWSNICLLSVWVCLVCTILMVAWFIISAWMHHNALLFNKSLERKEKVNSRERNDQHNPIDSQSDLLLSSLQDPEGLFPCILGHEAAGYVNAKI